MVSKPTALPVQSSMCESVRLLSLNDMCHYDMQRRNATQIVKWEIQFACEPTNASHVDDPVLF